MCIITSYYIRGQKFQSIYTWTEYTLGRRLYYINDENRLIDRTYTFSYIHIPRIRTTRIRHTLVFNFRIEPPEKQQSAESLR